MECFYAMSSVAFPLYPLSNHFEDMRCNHFLGTKSLTFLNLSYLNSDCEQPLDFTEEEIAEK